jgi:hypothetical protein
MRVSEKEEELGLDLSQHGESLDGETLPNFDLDAPMGAKTILPVGITAKSGVSA